MPDEYTEIIEETPQEVDLLAEMQKATEYKAEVQTAPIGGGNHSESDFEAEPEPEKEKEDSEDEEISAEDLTELIISASEMLVEGIFPAMYRSTIPKDDLQVMNELKRVYRQAKDKKTKVLEFTERQQEVMEVYLDYDDYCENLPLTPKETKKLRKPLQKVLAKVNFKASPEHALMAVAAMILLPRSLPIAGRKFSHHFDKK
jgi:hypothetical protein